MKKFSPIPLSYAFVGMLRFPDRQAPFEIPIPFDREFCLCLFGDPVKTEIKLTQEGLLVVKPGSITKTFQFNPVRFAVLSDTISDTATVTYKVYRKLLDKHDDLIFEIPAYGLNYEIELTVESADNVEKWLGGRFVKGGLRVKKGWDIAGKSVKFTVGDKGGIHVSLTLEPRAGDPRKLFVAIGNHIPVSEKKDFNEDNLKTDMAKWYDKSMGFICDILEDR